jgi:methyltransferase family protein
MHEHVRLRQDGRRSIGPVPALVEQFSQRRLTWWPQLGIGYYPVEVGIAPYDQDYFDRFARDADSFIGQALMQARVELVARYYHGPLIDIGIGSGAFVDLRRHSRPMRPTFGYDVNPCGIEWLQSRKLLADPYAGPFEAASMWDVLEHMPDYPLLLTNVREWLFLSLPIFRDAEHVLRSKHFRPLEHCWYFTSQGLVIAMESCGFALVAESDFETELGREDIGSFVFRRQR